MKANDQKSKFLDKAIYAFSRVIPIPGAGDLARKSAHQLRRENPTLQVMRGRSFTQFPPCYFPLTDGVVQQPPDPLKLFDIPEIGLVSLILL